MLPLSSTCALALGALHCPRMPQLPVAVPSRDARIGPTAAHRRCASHVPLELRRRAHQYDDRPVARTPCPRPPSPALPSSLSSSPSTILGPVQTRRLSPTSLARARNTILRPQPRRCSPHDASALPQSIAHRIYATFLSFSFSRHHPHLCPAHPRTRRNEDKHDADV
ncbi:hypothetical protein DFH09DRAFT_1500206 [Mycena vulgaris]|nr:hypothetical protein DFH09DRAFT_1500206 [Mycena vulgaris]